MHAKQSQSDDHGYNQHIPLQWVAGNHTSNRTVSYRVANDLEMFKEFLTSKDYFVTSVPFLDRLGAILADACGSPDLGFGCFSQKLVSDVE